LCNYLSIKYASGKERKGSRIRGAAGIPDHSGGQSSFYRKTTLVLSAAFALYFRLWSGRRRSCRRRSGAFYQSDFDYASRPRNGRTLRLCDYRNYDFCFGFVLQAKDSGAKGYISKVAKEEELAHCLEVVQNGGTYIEQYMAEAQNKIDSIVSVLSKQERNIFEAILQEKSNKEICDQLFISPRTVENYTSRLYAKIGVKSREELIERFK
jgi:DNA-binding CsgD family transcriptional regulator